MATVYKHLRNDTGTPFYVGAGKTTKRAYSTRNRNKHWHDIVNAHGYTVDIIHEGISWEEALKVEQYLISFYGRKDLGKGGLINLTDGGLGMSNYKQSEEQKAKIGITHTGRVFTEERKAKLSAALTGKPNSKISAALTGRVFTEEWKAKLSAAGKGKPKSEEHKANMRKAAKLRWESKAGLQKRAEMSELLTNYHKSINN